MQGKRVRGIGPGFFGLAAVTAVMVCVTASASAGTLVFHAVSSAQRALDQGEGGGNPFASALIETLSNPKVRLGDLPDALKALTHAKSGGRMAADVPAKAGPAEWTLVPASPGEKRKALVLAVSDYTKTGGAKSLPGAKHDANRIAAALTAAGFATEVALDLDQAGIKEKLAAFGSASRTADAAVIYTTGHGVEVDGRAYLIPADYPVKERNAALASRAVPLTDIAAAIHAKSVNLVFYGGCRDNPFGANGP